jgi:hypothetical protein
MSVVKMKEPPQSNFDPQQIYLHGCRFQFASERLMDPQNLKTGDYEKLVHPAAMLSAFASELYLKRTHNEA